MKQKKSIGQINWLRHEKLSQIFLAKQDWIHSVFCLAKRQRPIWWKMLHFRNEAKILQPASTKWL